MLLLNDVVRRDDYIVVEQVLFDFVAEARDARLVN